MSAARDGDGRGDRARGGNDARAEDAQRGSSRGPTLCVYGYAAAGPGSEGLPATRRVPLPEPGTRRAGGRLARLALDLARAAFGEDAAKSAGRATSGGGALRVDESTGVLFGTAFGALTETDDFVAHLVAADEATPRARSFSASVHNALASYVALQLGARGECSTFVHDDIAFAHALLAAQAAARRDPSAAFLVGALDEAPPGALGRLADAAHGRGVADGSAAPTSKPKFPWTDEGGAVLACGPERADERILARVGPIALARFPLDESARDSSGERDARVRAWFAARFEASGAELLIVAPGCWNAPITDVVGAWPTDSIVVLDGIPHGSSLATAVALGVSLLAGHVREDPRMNPTWRRRIGIAGRTAAGDACVISLDAGSPTRRSRYRTPGG